MGIRERELGNIGRTLVICVALIGALAFSVAPAQAETTHAFSSQFGTGSLSIPAGVAVDNDSSSSSFNDVYVADLGEPIGVAKFDAAGNFIENISSANISGPNCVTAAPFSGPAYVAVDASTGDLYVSDYAARTITAFGPTGTCLFQISSSTPGIPNADFYPFGPAVDPAAAAHGNTNAGASGALYVSNRDTGQIDEFDPATGAYIGEFGGQQASAFDGLAVDPSGNVYVMDDNTSVKQFSAAGAFEATVSTNGTQAVGVDPSNGHILVGENGYASSFHIAEYANPGEAPIFAFGQGHFPANSGGYGIAVSKSSGKIYVSEISGNVGDIFGPSVVVPDITTGGVTNPSQTSATLTGHVDPAGGGEITDCHFEYVSAADYNPAAPNPYSAGSSAGVAPCTTTPPSSLPYTSPTDVSADIGGLTTETVYHYRLVGANVNGANFGQDQIFTPHAVAGLSTDPATNIAPTSATLNGSFIGNGEHTRYYFEWGTDTSYGNTTAIPPGADAGSPPGPNRTVVTPFDLNNLQPVTTYHYQIVATNSIGTSVGGDQVFTTPPLAPVVSGGSVSDVRSDVATLHADINPGGGDTTYHFEYGTDESYGNIVPIAHLGPALTDQSVSALLSGLSAGTVYHFRVVAQNATDTTAGPDHTFRTFDTGTGVDTCPNAHVRQQTGAALLLDCRAYELVSAANTGGYDVESSLVEGQHPYGGYPQASGPPRVLYAVHSGVIAGTGNPTNSGPDPYVATRTADGWTTRYVGIPENGILAAAPFASTLGEADPGLDTFAFAGSGLCSPCFGHGIETGIPLRLPDGSLIQGMAGSIEPAPSAKAAGFIGKDFSADGTHFVFGSTSQFESDANSGEISIYDRNLKTGETHVVSKTPAGANISCLIHCSSDGIGELDISSNGSRIIVGQLISTDANGNKYFHLYMNVDDSSNTIDLTPGTASGVLYDGMTADGSKVFFTTSDQLTNDDTDNSADIYEMDISDPQNPKLARISTGSGGAGNTDSCDPSGEWNTVNGGPNCNTVAIGGGGGVASGDGTIYFLSPERLDGASNGAQDQPNLYVVRPGFAPHFIATIDSSIGKPPPPPPQHHTFAASFGASGSGAGQLSGNMGIAVDSAGDVYVADRQNFRIEKFDKNGNFISMFGKGVDQTTSGDICTATSGDICKAGTQGSGGAGFDTNSGFSAPTFVAVDNSNGPSAGDVYVADTGTNAVDKFDSSGAFISSNSGSVAPGGPFGTIAGIAVDSGGDLWVMSTAPRVFEFAQDGSSTAAFNVDCCVTPVGIAVDSAGNLYRVRGSGAVQKFDSQGNNLGIVENGPATGLAVYPGSTDLFVSHSSNVVHYDAMGNVVQTFGSGNISSAQGIAIGPSPGDVYVSDLGGEVESFTAPAPPPTISNPAVVDAVNAAGTRNTADFQVTPDGRFAVFVSDLPLTPTVANAGHTEVYRYGASSDMLNCVSCNPTGEADSGDGSLSDFGLGLTNDGRVFFNSTEVLAARDEDNRSDVYEWSNGDVGLISTGTSPFDSSLLSASADGTDAYFFTRDSLVPQDQNGQRVKIYDARAGGGIPFTPPPPPCAASDECHGPGSQAPGPPEIRTAAGNPGNLVTVRKKKHPHKKHHKKHHRRAARRSQPR